MCDISKYIKINWGTCEKKYFTYHFNDSVSQLFMFPEELMK